MGHVLGFDEGVEFFGSDIAEFEGGFTEAMRAWWAALATWAAWS